LMSKSHTTKTNLTVSDVFEKLSSLVHTTGKDSTATKISILSDLLSDLDGNSARYVVRMVLGKLRLGFSDKTILDALSVTISNDKSSREVIEKAYYRCSDLGMIASILHDKGIKGIEHISLIPSVPVFAKLVERASSVDEILKRIPTPLFQPKYDGMRGQIHLFTDEKGKRHVKIFSRRLEDLTEMFPDICEDILASDIKSVILDSEIIGFNQETNEFFPFQETMQRKRKFNVSDLAAKIPVISFVFDILYLNGKDLTDETLEKRMEILTKFFSDNHFSILRKSESIVMHSKEEAEKYFYTCVENGLEGIIAKDLQTPYSPGTRNFEWIKLKRASVNELNDTIDCIVLGYYHGHGQRAKYGVGALLIGIYNSDEDRFETIAKLGSGIKDDQLGSLRKTLDGMKENSLESNVIVDKKLIPDVIVEPKMVVVVRADEITRSSLHTAGRNKEGIGYALRFPRMIEIREDKAPDEITSLTEIEHITKSKMLSAK